MTNMENNNTEELNILFSNTTFPGKEFQEPITFDGQILLVVLGTFVFVENLVVLIVLICGIEVKKKHKVEFILWLSLSDIEISISCIMLGLSISIETISNNVAFCCTVMHLVYAGITQSLAHTFLVCFERYIAVANFNTYHTFTKQYKYVLIFGICLFVQVYTGIMAGLFLRTESISACRLASYPDHTSFQMAVSVVCLPLLIFTLGVYILFMMTIREKLRLTHPALNMMVTLESQNVHNLSSIHNELILQRRRKKAQDAVVTVGSIVFSLLILSGPYVVFYFLEGFSLVKFAANTTGIVTGLMVLNSFLNPFLYAIRIPTFRKEFKRVFKLTNC